MTTAADTDRRRGRRSASELTRRAATGAAVAALVALLVGAVAFRATGGRWFVVRTPSMGTAAPVGTLALTRPSRIASLHVGDVVAFHPPTAPGETYTHRIVSISAAGVRTRGDINGATDPWPLTDHTLVGRVVLLAPGWGWLIRGLPLVVLGGVLLWVLTGAFVRTAWRGPVRMVGGALLVSFTAAYLRPFISVANLAVTQNDDGSASISLVSTGLLPVRVTPRAGHGEAGPVDLHHAGERGVSRLHGAATHGRYEIATHLHLTPWQWVVALAVCATPLLWTLVVGFQPVHRPRHAAPEPA